jgi:hypothetical protein
MTLQQRCFLFTIMLSTQAWANFNPSEVGIESVTAAGNGCHAGSVQVILAPDASAITVLYDQLQAQADSVTHQQRKNCDVIIKFKKPKIYSFAIESADFRGYVFLERGAKAQQVVKLETGTGDLAKLNLNIGARTWIGPVDENFILRAQKPNEGLKFLSCIQPKQQGRLRVKSVITVENGRSDAQALISVDSLDGRLVQRYNLKWVNCLEFSRDLIEALGRR